MVRLIGAGILGLCCLGAGFSFARRRIQRVRQLEACLQMVNTVTIEMQYHAIPILRLVQSLSETPSLAPLRFLPLCREKMAEEPFPRAFAQALREAPGALEHEDLRAVSLMGELGSTDLEGQQHTLETMRERLTELLEQARERQGREAKLCRTLGALAGAGVFLLAV